MFRMAFAFFKYVFTMFWMPFSFFLNGPDSIILVLFYGPDGIFVFCFKAFPMFWMPFMFLKKHFLSGHRTNACSVYEVTPRDMPNALIAVLLASELEYTASS